jgi:hypothetical protein
MVCRLLDIGLAVPEQGRLGVVIRELFGVRVPWDHLLTGLAKHHEAGAPRTPAIATRLLARARSGHRAKDRSLDLYEVGCKRHGKLRVFQVIERPVDLDAFADMQFELILRDALDVVHQAQGRCSRRAGGAEARRRGGS